jgi:hypothetical protein
MYNDRGKNKAKRLDVPSELYEVRQNRSSRFLCARGQMMDCPEDSGVCHIMTRQACHAVPGVKDARGARGGQA